MAMYQAYLNSSDSGETFNFIPAESAEFTPTGTVNEYTVTNNLDGKQYSAISFSITQTQLFNYFDYETATQIISYNNATIDDFEETDTNLYIRFTKTEGDPVKFNLYEYGSIQKYIDVNNKFSKMLVFESGLTMKLVNVPVVVGNPNEEDTSVTNNNRFTLAGFTGMSSQQMSNFLNPLSIVNNKNVKFCFCLFKYQTKQYMGLLIVGTNAGSEQNTYQGFAGFEIDYFGKPVKPKIGKYNQPSGGIYGNFDDTSSGITMTPNNSGVLNGLIHNGAGGLHVYQCLDSVYHTITASFFSTDFGEQFKNYKYSPWDSVLAVYKLPIIVPESAAVPVRANGVTLSLNDVPISAPMITQTQIDNFIGEIDVPLYSDSYLDYAPYTTAKLYLPFVGFVDVDINKIMGGKISVWYRFDILTGNCLAIVYCQDRFGVKELTNMHGGNCAIQLPITGSYNNMGAIIGNIGNIALGAVTGNVPQMVSAAMAIDTAPVQTAQTSAYTANLCTMSCLQTYLIITRNEPSSPENYLDIVGTTSEITSFIGDLSGFVQAREIHFTSNNATNEEKRMIEDMIKSGIIV